MLLKNDIAYYYDTYYACARSAKGSIGTPVPCKVKFTATYDDVGTPSNETITCEYIGLTQMQNCDFSGGGSEIFAMTKGLIVSFDKKQAVPPDTVIYLDDLDYLTAG